MRDLFLWLHAASTVTWFGGLFFYVVVASPAVRKIPDREGMRVLNEIDRRFRHVLWGSVEVAAATGVALVVLTMIEKGTTMKVSGAYTQVLMGKLFLTLVMVALQLYNQIRIYPRKASIAEGQANPDAGLYAELQARTLQLYSLQLVPAAGLVWLGLQMRTVL
jgi:uncharacterized membrane protein